MLKPRRCSVLWGLACFFAIGTTASAAETQEVRSGAHVTIVEGQVVFEGGAALEGVMVFCIDGATSLVVAAANSDHHGRVSLTVPAGHKLVWARRRRVSNFAGWTRRGRRSFA